VAGAGPAGGLPATFEVLPGQGCDNLEPCEPYDCSLTSRA